MKVTAARTKRYEMLKAQAIASQSAFWSHWDAVSEIRDDELWDQEFESFKEFCEQVLAESERQVYRMLEAVSVRNSVIDCPIGQSVAQKLTNEAQARELAKVPAGKRGEVLKKAAQSGHVTAASIKQAAQPVPKKAVVIDVAPAKEEAQLDETGYKLTPTAAVHWAKRDTVQNLMTGVSKGKNAFEAIMDDPLFYRRQDILKAFQSLYHLLSECKPYAVCPECEGYPEKQDGGTCIYCHKTGVLHRAKYTELLNSNIPAVKARAKRGRAQA